MKTIKLFFILILFFLIGSGCIGQKSSSLVSNDITNNAPELIVPDTTKSITDGMMQNLESISTDKSEFIFNSTEKDLNIEVGDVIVGSDDKKAPLGFLRKVTSISKKDGKLVVKTKQASLEEAITDTDIKISRPLSDSDVESFSPALEGVRRAPSRSSLSKTLVLEFADVVIYDADGNKETTNDQIKLNGELELSQQLDVELAIKSAKLQKFIFKITSTEKLSMSIGSQIELLNVDKKEKLEDLIKKYLGKTGIGTYKFKRFVIAYAPLGIPIWAQPIVTVYVGFEGSASIKMEVSMEQSLEVVNGVSYVKDDGWSTTNTLKNSFDYSPPSISANCDFKAYAGPEFMLKICDVVGPTATLTGYVGFHADIEETPWWKLYSGIEGIIGVKIEILSYNLVDYEKKLIDYEKTLAQATILDSMTLNTNEVTIFTNETYDLSNIVATVKYSDKTTLSKTEEIKFEKISGNGNLTGNEFIASSTEGDVILKVSYTEGPVTKTSQLKIVVKPKIYLTSLTSNLAATSIEFGKTYNLSTLTITAKYSDGKSFDKTSKIVWSKISGDGTLLNEIFTAPSTEGTTLLRGSYTDNGITKSVDFTIVITSPAEVIPDTPISHNMISITGKIDTIHNKSRSMDLLIGKNDITCGEYMQFLSNYTDDDFFKPSNASLTNEIHITSHITYNGIGYKLDKGYLNSPVSTESSGVIRFCNYLSKKEELEKIYDDNYTSSDYSKNGYRLATEEEINFASNGGNFNDESKYEIAKYNSGAFRLARKIETSNEKAATPKLTPAGGTYATTQKITLSSETNDCNFIYTLNNTIPSVTNGYLYSKPIEISVPTHLNVVAIRYGLTISDVVTESYTVNGYADDTIIKYTIYDTYAKVSSFYNSPESVKIPPTYLELPVNKIDHIINNSITSITLPSSMIISDNCFEEYKLLTSIEVENDNPYLFSKDGILFDKELKRLIAYPPAKDGDYTVPAGVTSIEYNGFLNCVNLKNVIIPDGVKEIGNDAFSNCNSLISATLSDSIVKIGSSAFYNCSSLQTINIPEGITNMEAGAFSNCSSLTSMTIPDGITKISDSLFKNCSSLETVNLSSKVTEISDFSFSNCSKLKNITIPDSVEKIGNSAFSNCSSLVTITIPNGVTKLESFLFSDCSSLQAINFSDNITQFGSNTFLNCSSLKEIYIPAEITEIDKYIFSLPNLAKIIVSDNNSNFSSKDGILYDKNFTSLKACPLKMSNNITLPDNLIKIEKEAFRNNQYITSMTMPVSLTTIEDESFYLCSNLTSVHFLGNAPSTFGNDVFRDCSPDFKIYYEAGTTGWSNPWNGYVTEIYGNNNITYTDKSYFKYEDNGNGLTITGMNSIPDTFIIHVPPVIDGKSVTIIGTSAFDVQTNSDFSKVTEITIPDSVTKIEDVAFGSCSKITEFNIPEGVTSIGESAFTHCYNLKTIIIPSSVTSIGAGCFDSCINLESVTLNNGLLTIGDYGFGGCSSLASITIPSTVTSIGVVAFSSCEKLTSAYFEGNAPTASSNSFSGTDSNFKIYYKSGKSGWSNPWNGYTTEVY